MSSGGEKRLPTHLCRLAERTPQPCGGQQRRAAAPRGGGTGSPQISHPLGAHFWYDPAIRKESKPSPTESPLLFDIDPQPIEETLTALGGIPLVVQAFRSLGLPQSVREQVRVKERDRGYDAAIPRMRDRDLGDSQRYRGRVCGRF
jgi:hypothetical protein